MKTQSTLISIMALGLILALGSTAQADRDTLLKNRPKDASMRLVQYGFDKNDVAWMTPAQMHQLSHDSHEKGVCGSYIDVTDFPEYTPTFFKTFSNFSDRMPTQQSEVMPRLDLLSKMSLHDFVNHLSSYQSRKYNTDTGKQAVEWMRDKFKEMSSTRSDVKVELFNHASWKQPSVIARIEGEGKHAEEVIVLGAHADSINQLFFDPNAPGADDDASGLGTLLEAFRVLMESSYKPKRTIEFMGYAAEEIGLRGSQEIAQKYRNMGRKVVAVLQFDMTLHPGSGNNITFITDHVDSDLTKFIKGLTDEYVRVPWEDSKCGYGCSDHASWTRAGFAAAFPFESPFNESNKAIHTANDTIEKLDFAFGLHYAKIAVSFAIELGSDTTPIF